MTDWLTTIRDRYDVDESEAEVVLRATAASSGFVRWSAEVTSERAQFYFSVVADSPSTRPARTPSFMRALAALIEEHFDLHLTVEHKGDSQSFFLEMESPDVTQSLETLENIHERLALVFSEIGRGRDPFTVLGEQDIALARGERGPVQLSPASDQEPSHAPASASAAEDTSGEPSTPEEEAPDTALPAEENLEWLARDDEKGAGPRMAGWALGAWARDDGDSDVVVVLGLNALPTGAGDHDLALALRSSLIRRFDLHLELESKEARSPHFDGLRYLVRLRGKTARDMNILADQLKHFMQNLVEFIRGGLGAAEVLQFEPTSRPLVRGEGQPPSPDSDESGRDVATGDGFDVYLEHAGYSDSRIRQMLGVLLSVDVIQAQQLVERLPTLILNNVTRDRAEEAAALIRRTGGKAAIRPAGAPLEER